MLNFSGPPLARCLLGAAPAKAVKTSMLAPMAATAAESLNLLFMRLLSGPEPVPLAPARAAEFATRSLDVVVYVLVRSVKEAATRPLVRAARIEGVPKTVSEQVESKRRNE